MKAHMKAGLTIGGILLSIYFVIYAYRSHDSHTSMLFPERTGSPVQAVKEMPSSPTIKAAGTELSENKGLLSSPVAKGSKDRASVQDREKIKAMINNLADLNISRVERNRIEHELGSSPEKAINKEIRVMLEDGLIDLSDQSGMGIERLISAIRIAGLRSDTDSLKDIIHICTHPESTEDVRMAGYEALGYMGTEEATAFLREELSHRQDGFVRSQIVLSLGSAEDMESSSRFLTYLKSPDPDLRESAIIALGRLRDARAVPEFKKIYEDTTESSRALIVQALKDIDSPDANALMQQLTKKE